MVAVNSSFNHFYRRSLHWSDDCRTSVRYKVAWSDRDSRPAIQQADPCRAVVEYATLHADDVVGAIRPHGVARIGEDIAVRDGRDIGSTLRVNTAGIEGDERVIDEGATELIQQFIIESHETPNVPRDPRGYQPAEPSNLIPYRGSGHTNGEAASPCLCEIGGPRQCKSLSGCQRYFSLRKPAQRWAVQCVKPITKPRQQGDARLREQPHVWEPTSISWDKIFVAQILPASRFPAMQRTDGRGPDEIRSLNFELNVAPHASGSVLVSMGNTRVICAVTIEEAVPRWMKEQGVTGGWLTAEYSMLPYSTQPRKGRDIAKGRLDGRSVEIQRLIGRSLRAVMDLEKLGPRTIWIDCDVLQADGGTRTTAITGSSLALAIACRKLVRERKLDAPPMKKLVAAVSAGILDGQAIVDLNYEEDKLVTVDFNLVATEDGEFVEVQSSGEEATFSGSQLDGMLTLGRKGISALIGAQRAVLARIMVTPPES